MMAQYSYEIGTTSTTTNLESLTVPVYPPVPASYTPWSRVYDKGNGLCGADGYPVAKWHFAFLTAAQVAQLKTASGVSGKSGATYIKTRIDTNSFAKYSCVMIWDDRLAEKRIGKDTYGDVEIEFRMLVAV